MTWEVDLSDDVVVFIRALPEPDRKEVLATVRLLRDLGPQLERPHAGTLRQNKKAKYRNLKELRIPYETKQYRIIFAFDPRRRGILLVGGDKVPAGEEAWYAEFIPKAIWLYEQHLMKLEAAKKVGASEPKHKHKQKPKKRNR